MKQSLAWLWLIGAVLYAVSKWLSADAVNVVGEQKPVASLPTIATPIAVPPITESEIETDCGAEIQRHFGTSATSKIAGTKWKLHYCYG